MTKWFVLLFAVATIALRFTSDPHPNLDWQHIVTDLCMGFWFGYSTTEYFMRRTEVYKWISDK